MSSVHEPVETETVSLTIPSHPRFLYVVRSAVYPLVLGAGFSRKETRLIILALDEACSNIIKYAYGGNASKQIELSVTVTTSDMLLQLRDTGKKVDASRIAPRELTDIRPGGLGTHFMNSIFDSIKYDTSEGEGTVLTMIKKRPTTPHEVRA